jgi:glycine C-acetyltransferase
MDNATLVEFEERLKGLKEQGLFKEERIITSPQSAKIKLESGEEVLNFCANNYLGLADHPRLIEAAKEGLDQYGLGLASVRFICGTQDIHKKLEEKISSFLETDETILYSSCFDANGGLFETFLDENDAIISDSLNHASIIDGIRLCKAERHRYAHNDMTELEEKLKATHNKRYRMIATDGVFSMDGTIADLKAVCDLSDKYNAWVMVDECHATGFLGERGKGSIEYCDVLGRVDLITGTLGKALGGASGGFVSGRGPLIKWLRQKSRPYLFSNTLMPAIVSASIAVFDLVENGNDLRKKLNQNARHFREKMTALGFQLLPGTHPIIPVMLGDAKLASAFAKEMLDEGVYVIGFSFPVVPMGKARIRTQMSAAHSQADIDQAIHAFEKVGKKLGVIK